MGNHASALLAASQAGDVAAIDAALAAGESVHATFYNGWSPYPDDSVTNVVWEAAYRGHTAAVRRLLDAGGSVNYTDEEGRSAVYAAAMGGHVGALSVLLAAGASPLGGKPTGKPAIAAAVESGSVEAVKLLLRANADSWLPNLLAPRVPDADVAIAFRSIAYASGDTGDAIGRLLLQRITPSQEDRAVAFERAAEARSPAALSLMLEGEAPLIPVGSPQRDPHRLTTLIAGMLMREEAYTRTIVTLHRAGGGIDVRSAWLMARDRLEAVRLERAMESGSTTTATTAADLTPLERALRLGCIPHAAWEKRRVAVVRVALWA